MPGRHTGQILWTDLTVKNAEAVRAFYEAVIGWTPQPVEMETRTDYMMVASGERPTAPEGMEKIAAGICNAIAEIADMPPQWLNYWGVEDLDASRAACEAHGGKLLTEIKTHGNSRYCAISDPAGAVCGLFEQND